MSNVYLRPNDFLTAFTLPICRYATHFFKSFKTYWHTLYRTIAVYPNRIGKGTVVKLSRYLRFFVSPSLNGKEREVFVGPLNTRLVCHK